MEQIRLEKQGWVVINIGHPATGMQSIVESTFSSTRTVAIKKFIKYSEKSWSYWRSKYNFRCVKATQTIVAAIPAK